MAKLSERLEAGREALARLAGRRVFDSYLRPACLPARGQGHGQPGTTRLDVVERVDATTACVYDIKSGRRGLSMGRLTELTSRAQEFTGVEIVIVVQVIPQ